MKVCISERRRGLCKHCRWSTTNYNSTWTACSSARNIIILHFWWSLPANTRYHLFCGQLCQPHQGLVRGVLYLEESICDPLNFFRRYIDDRIIIWVNSPSFIDSVVQYCNSNNMGLLFTHVWNSTSLVFSSLGTSVICTLKADYVSQGALLKSKFLDKWYNTERIDKAHQMCLSFHPS